MNGHNASIGFAFGGYNVHAGAKDTWRRSRVGWLYPYAKIPPGH